MSKNHLDKYGFLGGKTMLNEKQQKCIILMITSNKTQKQIANEIQVSENTICEWKKDKEFKEEIKKQMQENFGLIAIEAQQKLKKLLNSKNENIQIQAIKDILDRAGYKPIEKAEVTGASIVQLVDDVNE